jgi:hypothetical protein
MKKLQQQMDDSANTSDDDEAKTVTGSGSVGPEEDEKIDAEKKHAERRESIEQEALDYSYEDETRGEGFAPIRPTQSRPEALTRVKSYDANPFDLDRVNTRDSFKNSGGGKLSRSNSRASKASKVSKASKFSRK